MPSRDQWPGNVVFGEEATSANIFKLPGGAVGAETDTSPATVTGSTDIVSITVTLPAGRSIEVRARGSVSDADNDAVGGVFNIYEGATDLGRCGRHPDLTEGSFLDGAVFLGIGGANASPSAGSHTYKLVADVTSGDMAWVGPVDIVVIDHGPELT